MWTHAPTSGAGAGLYGGRANRVGLDALYLSNDSQTAIKEYQQLSPLISNTMIQSPGNTYDSVRESQLWVASSL